MLTNFKEHFSQYEKGVVHNLLSKYFLCNLLKRVVIHLHAYTYKVLQNFRWAYERSALFYVAVSILDYTRLVPLCLVKRLERSGCGEIVQKRLFLEEVRINVCK
jgi:hypothetical protein